MREGIKKINSTQTLYKTAVLSKQVLKADHDRWRFKTLKHLKTANPENQNQIKVQPLPYALLNTDLHSLLNAVGLGAFWTFSRMLFHSAAVEKILVICSKVSWLVWRRWREETVGRTGAATYVHTGRWDPSVCGSQNLGVNPYTNGQTVKTLQHWSKMSKTALPKLQVGYCFSDYLRFPRYPQGCHLQ